MTNRTRPPDFPSDLDESDGLQDVPRKPCDCCAHPIIAEPYEICSRCGWEDDPHAAEHPDEHCYGPNHLPLSEAAANFSAYGACDPHSYRMRTGRVLKHRCCDHRFWATESLIICELCDQVLLRSIP